MWAINEDKSIETTLCINCKECVNLCPKGAYSMKWGRKNAGGAKQN
jgi:formate hydrogenlyase subunit 6/NADH:ubiquinone oxidoreductase subunit I